MKRNAEFWSKPNGKWTLSVDGARFMGVGNVMKDRNYFDILRGKLSLGEGMELEEIMDSPRFNDVEKPVMFRIDVGPMGDNIIPLKPGYIERQEAIGTVLQFLLDGAAARTTASSQE